MVIKQSKMDTKTPDASFQYSLCKIISKSPNIFVLLLIKETLISLLYFILP